MATAAHMRLLMTPDAHRWTVNNLSNFLKWKYPQEEQGLYLIGRGMSGAMMISTLSYLTGIPFILVRKSEDITHSPHSLEYNGTVERCIFVDDFISNGNTLLAVKEEIDGLSAKLEGMIFHYDYGKYSMGNILSSLKTQHLKLNCWMKFCMWDSNPKDSYDWFEENFHMSPKQPT